MAEDKGQYVPCHLTSVICYLTPDTRNLKPCFYIDKLTNRPVGLALLALPVAAAVNVECS